MAEQISTSPPVTLEQARQLLKPAVMYQRTVDTLVMAYQQLVARNPTHLDSLSEKHLLTLSTNPKLERNNPHNLPQLASESQKLGTEIEMSNCNTGKIAWMR